MISLVVTVVLTINLIPKGDNVPDDKKDVTTGEQGGGNATDPWDIPSIPNTFIGESKRGAETASEPSDKGQQRPIKP